MNTLSDDNTIISRIRQLREHHAGKRGKARFSNELGISASTYNYYEHDRVPPAQIIYKICRLTGADIYWLLTGQNQSSKNRVGPKPTPEPCRHSELFEKIDALLNHYPDSAAALNAFVDLLEKNGPLAKTIAPTPPGLPSKTANQRKWLPILGRTAAGMVHFWDQGASDLHQITRLGDLIERHQNRNHQEFQSADVSSDLAGRDWATVDSSAVRLIQLTEPTAEGISEFIDCAEVARRFPDAFGLRVDGQSMTPRIQDGDVVLVSPSVPARDAATAVVQLHNQIGVTCKLFRREKNKVHLIPINEQFATRVFDEQQMEWALAVLWRIRPGIES